MPGDLIPITVPDPLRSAWHDTSDWGNAKRLVGVAGGRLLWIEDLECWTYYDTRRWSLERGGMEAQRIAHGVIELINQEALALAEIAEDAIALRKRVGEWCTPDIAQKRVEVLRGHAVRSGSAGMTAGMLKQARSFLASRSDEFDQDPYVYNTRNYTLRFMRGPKGWHVKATPHDPADRLMQVADVEYDPKAACTFWCARLAMLTPDPEQLAAFQPLYGYTLTGLVSDQAFYVHQGRGGDGKSVTHMTLAALHGDYYRHAGVKTFLRGAERGGAEHRSDLVRLAGDIRFVTCDEPPKAAVWDGSTIKQITGSKVTARGANERREITYVPRYKLHVECNIIPRAPSDDKGFRRRFKLYQWQVAIDETAAGNLSIDLVLAKLDAERSGILNWMIKGAIAWLTTRVIPQPAAMTEVLQDFWADSSPLLEWMSEWCDTSDREARTGAKQLYQHFKEWCEAVGHEEVMKQTAFGRALRDKQLPSIKDGRGIKWRKGIRLRDHGMFVAIPPDKAADLSAPEAPFRSQLSDEAAISPGDEDWPL